MNTGIECEGAYGRAFRSAGAVEAAGADVAFRTLSAGDT